ncbi:MAG: ABC transporter substrate-binding protein [Rubrivivax sp.]
MEFGRRAVVASALGVAALGSTAAWPQAARRVRVLSTTEVAAVQPLIRAFERVNPAFRVDYRQLGSAELTRAFLADGGGSADVVWSSAMDLQTKLVNDGQALRYESPHARGLPPWAVWKHEAYATTIEPIVVAYHRQLLAEAEVPRTREALALRLSAEVPRFRDRVATYDIRSSGLGFLLAASDAAASPRYWDLVRSLGRCRASLEPETMGMLDAVAAGRALLAYNVLGSYAEAYARRHPEVAVAYLQDYTLLASRVAFISRRAPNPEGARAWLDHLLSPLGQQMLEEGGGFYGVRTDALPARAGSLLLQRLGDAARPIAIGPGLLAHLDRSSHNALLNRWRRGFEHPD